MTATVSVLAEDEPCVIVNEPVLEFHFDDIGGVHENESVVLRCLLSWAPTVVWLDEAATHEKSIRSNGTGFDVEVPSFHVLTGPSFA